VLLLHGDQDTITPVAETRALERALGDRCQLAVFPGEGHTLRSPNAQRRALEMEAGFLAAALLDRRQ
jgi:dipeptidyl aminopeptidase/acylaminoacyl peptidase